MLIRCHITGYDLLLFPKRGRRKNPHVQACLHYTARRVRSEGRTAPTRFMPLRYNPYPQVFNSRPAPARQVTCVRKPLVLLKLSGRPTVRNLPRRPSGRQTLASLTFHDTLRHQHAVHVQRVPGYRCGVSRQTEKVGSPRRLVCAAQTREKVTAPSAAGSSAGLFFDPQARGGRIPGSNVRNARAVCAQMVLSSSYLPEAT